MLVRLAEIEVDPARLDAYRAALAEEIEASVAREPGVLALQAVALAHAPHVLRLLEVYADRAAYEAHLRAPHFLAYKAAVEGMVTSLRLLDAEPVLMRQKPGFDGA
jgi:quinol monooxygenase YgiN